MNTVQTKVEKELWKDAASYVINKGKYVSIPQLQKEEKEECCCEIVDQRVLYGLIMSIKKPKDSAKKIQYQRQGKMMSSYSRLVLLRELQTGQGFYIIAPSPEDAFHMFRFPNVAFIGAWVAIYEPKSSGTIHKLPIITTKTSLVPIDVSPDTTNIRLSTVLDAVTPAEPVKTFLMEVRAEDVLLNGVGLPTACTAIMCDSLHKTTTDNRCPALSGGRSSRRCLMCSVSIRGYPVSQCEYSSEKLAQLLISKAVLQAEEVDLDELREKVRALWGTLANNNVSIICGGWYKLSVVPSDVPGDAPSHNRNIHLTLLRPKTFPPALGLISLKENQDSLRRTEPPKATLSSDIFQRNMPSFMTATNVEELQIPSDDEARPGASGSHPPKKARRDAAKRSILLAEFKGRRNENVDYVGESDNNSHEDPETSGDEGAERDLPRL